MSGYEGVGEGDTEGVPQTDPEALRGELEALLEAHSPDEVVVLSRAQLQRREYQAYASGWQDAERDLRPALERARMSAEVGRLRLVFEAEEADPATVLPFPRRPDEDAGGSDPKRSKPVFDVKPSGSRTPDIPPLRPHRPPSGRRSDRQGAGEEGCGAEHRDVRSTEDGEGA
ncbi:hypothetical protein ACFQLX_02730 [Streptomyces polyrhachis]|uniref:Uncharacterized protein n=1 Tax=Streptomyces polyrhachis TaxID=1282885 RepID=A0ABW2G8N5_9ACTN